MKTICIYKMIFHHLEAPTHGGHPQPGTLQPSLMREATAVHRAAVYD
jgi:hypothetical protein